MVNLLGGSGIGKSTLASQVFGKLKDSRVNTELVREVVKEWAWAGKKIGPFGQSILYGAQLERETALYGKVSVIVTDSPLLLYPVYQKHNNGHESIKHCVFHDMSTAMELGVTYINFLLKRTKPFDPRGRYEDEASAKLIDEKVKSFLIYHGINYIEVDVPSKHRVKFITETVLSMYSNGESNDRETMSLREKQEKL